MIKSRGYAAQSPKDALAPFQFERRDVGTSRAPSHVRAS